VEVDLALAILGLDFVGRVSLFWSIWQSMDLDLEVVAWEYKIKYYFLYYIIN
jgi:hypothetical protein